MRGWQVITWVALAVAFGAACADSLGSIPARARRFGAPVTVARISDERVSESSGLAPSRIADGTFYTHNDSGDSARFFRMNVSGKVLAEFKLEGAKAIDWEDMASAEVDGEPYLYFGDIGDNSGRRKEIVVYRVSEPKGSEKMARVDEAYRLEYPDEPRNAETLLVHPKSGEIFIVTKAAQKPTMIYAAGKPKPNAVTRMTKLGELQLGGSIRESRLVTSGDFAPDGRHLILRTYLAAYEFAVAEEGSKWWETKPQKVPTNLDLQGEAVAYTRSGDAIFTTSEKIPCQFSRISVSQ